MKSKFYVTSEWGGQRGRVFNPNGIVGALSATDYKDAEKVLVKEEDSNE